MGFFPEVIHEANSLANGLIDPVLADADLCWSKLWDKPLFANTRVSIAENYVDILRPLVNDSQWYDWGDPKKPYLKLEGPANRNDSFIWTPNAPENLTRLRIAKNRLFPIQGAAQALVRRSSKGAPFADLPSKDISDLISILRTEFGPRWGHTTILHFLTDLGLACKTDIHLVRTMRALKLVSADFQIQNLTEQQAVAINCVIKVFVRDLYGEVTPRNLRYVDKLMMEFSRQHLLKDELSVFRTVDFRGRPPRLRD